MRTPENKEYLFEIIKMRLDGYTIQQIADKYGVTKQNISQQLSVIAGEGKSRKRVDERIIYPNLAKWMYDNRIVKCELSQKMGIYGKSSTSLNNKLYGKTDFTITEIKKLLEITGETFEYLFEKKKD